MMMLYGEVDASRRRLPGLRLVIALLVAFLPVIAGVATTGALLKKRGLCGIRSKPNRGVAYWVEREREREREERGKAFQS